jgi:hypothetical protein
MLILTQGSSPDLEKTGSLEASLLKKETTEEAVERGSRRETEM